MNAANGLAIGGGSGGNAGNGAMYIAGSAAVSVSGISGLVVGQDAGETTGGTLNLSGGTLSLAGNLTLGSNGGIGAVQPKRRDDERDWQTGDRRQRDASPGRHGGQRGDLLQRRAELGQSRNARRRSCDRQLQHQRSGPVWNTVGLGLTSNIIGPWAVVQASGSNTNGDYLTTTATTLGGQTYHQLVALSGSGWDNNFMSSGSVVENVTLATALTSNTTVYAMMTSGTTALNSGVTLTVASGGMIFNGGLLSGGSVSFGSGLGATPMIYAGTSISGTINSAIQGSLGLVKFGPGTLVIAGSNTGLSGSIYVNSGALNIQNAWAMGASGPGNNTTVAVGATLQIQGNTAVGGNSITLNGTGLNGGGAIQNVQGNNSFAGPITLNSNALINTVSGTLTLSGPIQGSLRSDDGRQRDARPGRRQHAVWRCEHRRGYGHGDKLRGVGSRRGYRRDGLQRGHASVARRHRRAQRVADLERRGDQRQRRLGKPSGQQFVRGRHHPRLRQPGECGQRRGHAHAEQYDQGRLRLDRGRQGYAPAFGQQYFHRRACGVERDLECAQPQQHGHGRPVGHWHCTNRLGRRHHGRHIGLHRQRRNDQPSLHNGNRRRDICGQQQPRASAA